MEPWVDVYSPVLLIVCDDRRRVFGALISDALRQCEHYYGTPDACFLFKFAEQDNLHNGNKELNGCTTSIDPLVSTLYYF